MIAKRLGGVGIEQAFLERSGGKKFWGLDGVGPGAEQSVIRGLAGRD